MKTAPQIACGSLVFFCAAILLPGLAAAQQQPLSVSPTSVSVQATLGSNAPSQTVQLRKRGKPTTQVSWSVVQPTPPGNWVSVSPTSGMNDGTLTLTFTTSALAVGTHQTSFSVQSTSSPITVNCTGKHSQLRAASAAGADRQLSSKYNHLLGKRRFGPCNLRYPHPIGRNASVYEH